jgi:hypothetical protein
MINPVKALYVATAGVGLSAVIVHTELAARHHKHRSELMQEFTTARELIYLHKMKQIKTT